MERAGLVIPCMSSRLFPPGFKTVAASGQVRGEPRISISPKGQIAFNMAAYLRYRLESVEGVVLGHDEIRRVVGIALVNDPTTEGFLKLAKRRSNASVRARGVLEACGALPDRTTRYNLSQDPETKALLLALDHGILPTKRQTRGALDFS